MVNMITLSYLGNCGIDSIFLIYLFAQRVDEEIEKLLAVFLLVLLVGLGTHKFQGFGLVPRQRGGFVQISVCFELDVGITMLDRKRAWVFGRFGE